jgi:hypothetical protein
MAYRTGGNAALTDLATAMLGGMVFVVVTTYLMAYAGGWTGVWWQQWTALARALGKVGLLG